jgi:phospholipase D-like protein/putative oligomerization/nucleic acid binding protein
LKLLAADYPFLNIFWSMIIFFCWVAWIWLLIAIFSDLFRRHETSGWAKAAWVIFLIVLPFLGVLIYLIANSRGMAERNAAQSQASQEQFGGYLQSVAGSGGGAASELEKAKQLLDTGAISPAEFDSLKAKVLA